MPALILGLLIGAAFLFMLPGYVAGLFAGRWAWLVPIAWPPLYIWWDLSQVEGETYTLAIVTGLVAGASDEVELVLAATVTFASLTAAGVGAGRARRGRVRSP